MLAKGFMTLRKISMGSKLRTTVRLKVSLLTSYTADTTYAEKPFIVRTREEATTSLTNNIIKAIDL